VLITEYENEIAVKQGWMGEMKQQLGVANRAIRELE
jgi:hypothetical protein